MAIGHTRRLCACFIKEATEALNANCHTSDNTNHVTELELACIRTWIHEENSLAANESNLSDVTVRIKGVQHSGGEESEIKDGTLNVKQQPSGGAAENPTNDTEASGDDP